MVDRILEFIKNKYFIGAVVAVFLGLLINSIASYAQGKANEEEFKKFQEINNSLSSENPINLEDVDFEFDSIGFEIITKSVFAKKALAINLETWDDHKFVVRIFSLGTHDK